MHSMTFSYIVLFLFIVMCLGELSFAQESPQWSASIGASTWFSNCDIPAGGQDSDIHPSFGGYISIGYGKVRFTGTFFNGTFDVSPADGVTGTLTPPVQFADGEAQNRGFTSDGETKRLDASMDIRYEFNRYAQLSGGLVINRHKGNVKTYWFPDTDENGILRLPRDRAAPLEYTDTQYWLSLGFHGSAAIETISSRFSVFYNLAQLIIITETGSGKIIHPVTNEVIEFDNPRIVYEKGPDGKLAFMPNALEPRSFGSNVGFAISAGIGFQILDSPTIVAYGGYNLKYFAEKETDLIDHSTFKGPYLGLVYTIR